MRRAVLVTLFSSVSLLLFAATPSAKLPVKGVAEADGLPVANVDASETGLPSSDGHFRYVTFVAGKNTIVAKTAQHGGHVLTQATISGRYTIPAVAYDGSAAGLSADGETLVLINPRTGFPRKHTPLLVLDTTRLDVVKRIDLPGDFSFDALSPDGRDAYLVEYFSRNPTNYNVRVSDLRRERLVPKPIVDPDEAQEEMYGLPMNRATSPDGRWAYTLYDGTEHPFIHALDSSGRTAVCIDLDHIAPAELANMRLEVSADGGTIDVTGPDGPVVQVNTETWEATDVPPASATAPDNGSDDGAPWLLIGIAGATGIGAGALFLRRRGRIGGGAGPLEQPAP